MQPLPTRHPLSWVLHENVLFADSCYCPCYPGTSNTKTCPTRTTGRGIFTHGRATTTCERLNWPRSG
ncbi:hypothetical protein BGY98DRAFT_1031109 [Russula aff. rugulosa BPL654]|nr:hypothetical protein BGY98DRAFT_1031109 [Russula aff. rugulosa BPL654]